MNSTSKGDSIQFNACLDILCDIAREIVRSVRAVDMHARIVTFDGIFSCILVKSSQSDKFMSMLLGFGDRVLSIFASNRSRLEKFNCDGIFNECFRRWQTLIDVELFDVLSNRSQAWRASFSNPLQVVTEGVFDFYPVVVRCENINVQFFRYLVWKSRFASQIITLVNSNVSSLNASNMTVIIDRQGSRDSMASITPQAGVKSPTEVFSVLVASFINTFGTGHLAKLSNDLSNALAYPPNGSLETMLAGPPAKFAGEELDSVKKYLCSTLFSSVRRLGDTSFFSEGLAFLLRADMMAGRNETFTVLGLLLTSALGFSVDDKKNFKNEWIKFMLGDKHDLISSTIAFSISENRKEVKAIYRELAANSSCKLQDCVEWEAGLNKLMTGWDIERDIRLLRTTANGLGFAPVALDGGESVMQLSPGISSPSLNLREVLLSLQVGQESILAEINLLRLRLDWGNVSEGGEPVGKVDNVSCPVTDDESIRV